MAITSRRIPSWLKLQWAALLVTFTVGAASPWSGETTQPSAPADGAWASGAGFDSEPAGTDLDLFTHVPMSPALRHADKTAAFKLIFDADVPQEARAAFQMGADIWAVILESSIPIEVEVKWQALKPADDDKSSKTNALILGRARPRGFRRDFAGAPQRDTWYPAALANKLAVKDLDPGKVDIIATFNRSAPWYFGTDGATPRGKYDLVTIVLHELAHGLGLATSVKTIGKEVGWGIKDAKGDHVSPTVFDSFLKTQAGKRLVDTGKFANPSADLRAEATGRKLNFGGKLAAAANGGVPPPLHAPPVFKPGASCVHLAEEKYPPGQINSLLTPSTFRAEAVHHPGPVVIGMLRDLGWTRADGAPK